MRRRDVVRPAKRARAAAAACIVLLDAVEHLAGLHNRMEEWSLNVGREARVAGADVITPAKSDDTASKADLRVMRAAMTAFREAVSLNKLEQAKFRGELARRLRDAS
jgi:hypothetical protein